MGTHKLKQLDTFDFLAWVRNLGYENEFEFWQALSGLPSGTSTDHMIHYLSSLGYAGTPQDMLRQFMHDQIVSQGGSIDRLGTLYDLANCLFDLGLYVGAAHNITDDDGNVITDDDGNIITD